MKKLTKMLVSVLLILVLGVTTCVFTGVFSSAQAVATGVSVRFAGIDKEDWVVLDGTTIQDDGFKLTVSNQGEDDIIITNITHTGQNNISFTNYIQGMKIKADKEYSFNISGDVNVPASAKGALFTVTITYHIKKYPDNSSEKATAYVWCTSDDYITGHSEAKMNSGTLVVGLKAGLNLYPVNTSTYTTQTVERGQGPIAGQQWAGNIIPNNSTIQDPTTTTEIYVDKSHYKTWQDFGLKFNLNSLPFDDDGNIRETLNIVGMSMSLENSETMTLGFGGQEVSSLPGSDQGPSVTVEAGDVIVQCKKGALASSSFTGAIPDEEQSTIKFNLIGNGIKYLTESYGGIASITSANFEAHWTITVYNNNKAALRKALNDIALKGYNAASYNNKVGAPWTNYENALKSAYQTLGTINVKAAAVASALSTLQDAEAALINPDNNYRYAVVITYHYYYPGKDASNPILINSHPTYKMDVVNGSTFTPEVLSSSSYSKPITNKRVESSQTIQVDASNNYTCVFNQYYWYVDDSELQNLFTEFENWPTLDEEQNKLYDTDSWNTYANAIQAGRDKLAANSTTFQVDIDEACEAIKEARDNLQTALKDTLWLDEGITWAEQIINNEFDYEPYFDYYYDDVDYGWDTEKLFNSSYSLDLLNDLEDAYDSANELVSEPVYTKAQADAAARDIWNAIYALTFVDEERGILEEDDQNHADVNHYGYSDPFDPKSEDPGLKPLFDDIIDNTSGNYRLNKDDFTSDSWHSLQDALYGDYRIGKYMHASTDEPYPAESNVMGELYVPAYSMINNIFYIASQDDYNACRDNLLNKLNNLEYALNVSELSNLYNSIELNFDEDNFTPSSAAALNEELEKAAALIAKLDEPQLYGDEDHITQAQIDAQYNALQAVFAALVSRPTLVVDPNAPEGIVIDEETGYLYGESSGKTVGDVIADLTIMNIDDPDDVAINAFHDGEIKARDEQIATGDKLIVSVDDDECASVELVVKGDVTGDAAITQQDFDDVHDFVLGEKVLTGAYKKAADVNGDGVVDFADAVTILMKIK